MINMIRRLIRRYSKLSTNVGYNIGNKKFHNSLIDSLSPSCVNIGNNFVSGPGSMVLSHDASTFIHCGKYRVEQTEIGDNVFLGANSIILPGVKIGDNVIIGAGAVVSQSVEANVVVAGNPARSICTVDEYIKKCERKKCLMAPPESFFCQFDNIPISIDSVEKFNSLAEKHVKK
ncbi:acyltransferase [Agarivorans aestuarii]|uniref:acyltransferase n=1 Tax=Agarivorans aestuarii TaxID=1563703 RepID=UPI001C813FAE|nr:DapH/DapD/GlmU-related protein [Agarivorans aestuarii]